MRLIDADEIRIKPEYMHDICGVAMIRVEDIGRIINDMPTIQPEYKRGRWVQIQFRTIPHNRISKALKCSVCGKRKDKYVTWNFCPNCGADMRKREGNNV